MKLAPAVKVAALTLAAALTITPSLAQTTSAPPSTTATTTSGSKLAAGFSDWAGSPENSTALVNGLRSGQPITLTAVPSDPSGGAVTTTTFTPPTKPMGYGNVRIALSLAQQQLASQGVTQPTPQQLQTALMGGQLTTVGGTGVQTTEMQGVLQMRADGMGWGKIANTLGYKLGAVMSGKAATTTPAAATTTTATGSRSGITTAGGAGTGNAYGKTSHGKAGSGIVTAAGGSAGGISTGVGHGQGSAGARAGIVSAHGGGAGQSNAGGQGKGK